MVFSQLTRDPDWLDHRVQPDIKTRALQKKQKQQDVDSPVQDFFTFGESVMIIKRADNFEKFKPLLLKKSGFANVNQFEVGWQTVNDLRGRSAHGRGKFTISDESILDGYLQKFESVTGIPTVQ